MTSKLIKQQSELIQLLDYGETAYHPELIKTLKSFDLLKTTRKEIHLFDNSDDINGVAPVTPAFHAHVFESVELLNGESALTLDDNETSVKDYKDEFGKKYTTELKFDENLYLTSVFINRETLDRLRREFRAEVSNSSFLGGGYFNPLHSTIKDFTSSLTRAIEVFGYGNGVRAFGTSAEISKILQDFKNKKTREIKESNDSLFLNK